MSESTEQFEAQLLDYMDGKLSPAEAARVEMLLDNGNPKMAALVRGMLEDRQHLRDLTRPTAPPDLVERIMDHIERDSLLGTSIDHQLADERKQWFTSRLAIAAGLALVIGSFGWFVVDSITQHDQANKAQLAETPVVHGLPGNKLRAEEKPASEALAFNDGRDAPPGRTDADRLRVDGVPNEALTTAKNLGDTAPLAAADSSLAEARKVTADKIHESDNKPMMVTAAGGSGGGDLGAKAPAVTRELAMPAENNKKLPVTPAAPSAVMSSTVAQQPAPYGKDQTLATNTRLGWVNMQNLARQQLVNLTPEGGPITVRFAPQTSQQLAELQLAINQLNVGNNAGTNGTAAESSGKLSQQNSTNSINGIQSQQLTENYFNTAGNNLQGGTNTLPVQANGRVSISKQEVLDNWGANSLYTGSLRTEQLEGLLNQYPWTTFTQNQTVITHDATGNLLARSNLAKNNENKGVDRELNSSAMASRSAGNKSELDNRAAASQDRVKADLKAGLTAEPAPLIGVVLEVLPPATTTPLSLPAATAPSTK